MFFVGWYLIGLLAACVLMWRLNVHFKEVPTRGDAVWCLLSALGGPLVIVVVGFIGIIFGVFVIIDSDFWNEPLFGDDE